jgi:BirA family biotin operon repressor/biotin-[acetyl-CoA-carboxylase] ligase
LSNPPQLGNHILSFTETTSTNDLAKKMLQHNTLPDGAVLIAHYQTHGKGQHGKSWLSKPGLNLLCTFVIPAYYLAIDKQVYVNMAISLSVQQAIASFCRRQSVAIKWPNDVLVDGKKIAGILIENIVQGDSWKHCIAGIGVNVLQTNFDLENATSIKLETAIEHSIMEVLQALTSTLNHNLLIVQQTDCTQLHQSYLNVLHNIGQPIRLIAAETLLDHAILKSVDTLGRLVVDHAGITKTYSHAQARIAIDH